MEQQKNGGWRPDAEKMEALSRLSGKVAHDFNNILGAVEGYATLTANVLKDGDPIKADMGEIRQAVAKAAGLTRQLLVFAGRQALEKKPCDIGALLAGLPRKAAGPGREGFKIDLDLRPGLPALNADPACLAQALLNLLENAREAMPGGGTITVRAQSLRLAPAGVKSPAPAQAQADFVKISVSDSGPGMTPETLERIFEPFFTTKEKGKGTGFGLSEVYGITKHHNGWVEVESEPGRGSEFSIFLPVI
jgi:signal transduction histidine kinase